MKKLLYIIVFLISISTFISAQSISNVEVYQSGKDIVIIYTLDKQTDIDIFVSTDNGNSYRKLKAVSGDVGKNISPGSKQIMWNVLEEYDRFAFENVQFKVVSNTGVLPGVFSVGPSKKVYFSMGNLQYQASTSTWRFAEHQYDIIGADNSNISSTYDGWIDLFGWGTSGYNNKYPYMTSIMATDYGYGNINISVTNYDWGVYNAISNGGDSAGKWRVLTKDEWVYLFSSHQWGLATVKDVQGLMLLPDAWTLPSGATFTRGDAEGFATNLPNSAQWSAMQEAGAVFLPAAGFRNEKEVCRVGDYGEYWSSTYDFTTSAYYLFFARSFLNSSPSFYRYFGYSVRLVQNVK